MKIYIICDQKDCVYIRKDKSEHGVDICGHPCPHIDKFHDRGKLLCTSKSIHSLKEGDKPCGKK